MPLVIGAIIPIAAGAQRPARATEDAPVPRELALALLEPFGGPGIARARIVVGRAPAWLPADAVPGGRGVTALGAVEFIRDADAAGGRGTAVYVVPGAPDSVLGAYERLLERAGWQRARMGRERGGFVPAAAQRLAVLCRDSTAVFASAAPRGDGRDGTHLRLSVSTARRSSPCGEPREEEVGMRMHGGPPLPTLRAPEGVRSRGGSESTSMSGGGGIRTREIASRLTTELTPVAIAAHYADQLRTAGWSVQAPPVVAGDAVIQLFEAADSTGARWRGLLTVISAPAAGQRDVSLRLVRATDADDD